MGTLTLILELLNSFKGLLRLKDQEKFAERLRRAAGLRLSFLPGLVTLLEAKPGKTALFKLSCASIFAFLAALL